MTTPANDDIDWSLTTWEGARREQMRRWAAMPLEQIIQAIEDMGEFAKSVSATDKPSTVPSRSAR